MVYQNAKIVGCLLSTARGAEETVLVVLSLPRNFFALTRKKNMQNILAVRQETLLLHPLPHRTRQRLDGSLFPRSVARYPPQGNIFLWTLSAVGLEHLPYKQRVGGSNPSASTHRQTVGNQYVTCCSQRFSFSFYYQSSAAAGVVLSLSSSSSCSCSSCFTSALRIRFLMGSITFSIISSFFAFSSSA